MNSFTLKHVLLWKNYTNTYAEYGAESRKWQNKLLIASSTDELNTQVNEKLYLLSVLEQGGIIRLKLILDEIFFMSEAVV